MAGTDGRDAAIAEREPQQRRPLIIANYQRALAYELRDLPRRLRLRHLADAGTHLAEIDGSDWGALGAPEQWAEEYRAALGLPRYTRRGRWKAQRPVVKIAVFLVPLLAAALVAATVAWLHYQPLGTGGAEAFSPDNMKVEYPEHSDRTVLHYRDGGTFTFAVQLTNHGRVPVDVVGIDRARLAPFLAVARLYDQTDAKCCIADPNERVQFPVRVDAGSGYMLGVRFRVKNCEWYARGIYATTDTVPLRVRVLGVEHVVDMLIGPVEVDFPGPGTRDCRATPTG